MPNVGTYTVSIIANGEALQEYAPPDDEPVNLDGQIVKYIEATENTVFTIAISLSPSTRWPTGYKAVDLHVDGKFVDSKRYAETECNRQEGWRFNIKHVSFCEEGSWFKQAFMFKNLETSDETRKSEELKKIAQGLGDIRVKIFDVTRGELTFPNGPVHVEPQVVPEKALKGQPIDMSAGFGQKMPTDFQNFYNSKNVGSALADFLYKYRSRRALQTLDLIPATPEPQLLEERDVNALNPHELRQLLTHMRERGSRRTEQLAQVKQEVPKVKEDGASTLETRKRQPITIDTDDDDDECMIVEVKKRRVIKEEVVLDLT